MPKGLLQTAACGFYILADFSNKSWTGENYPKAGERIIMNV
jgi:hypothetical protein